MSTKCNKETLLAGIKPFLIDDILCPVMRLLKILGVVVVIAILSYFLGATWNHRLSESWLFWERGMPGLEDLGIGFLLAILIAYVAIATYELTKMLLTRICSKGRAALGIEEEAVEEESDNA
ncbi:hypothetical protein ACYPKM_01740 [Pseudomonas aeruginosa]